MDILLEDNGDGAEVVLQGGDLKGDGTLYNAVYLSLFNGESIANAFENYESDDEFEESLNLPITAQNLKIVQNKANNCLKWLFDENVAESVDCFAYGGLENKIELDISITEPTGDNQAFGIVWNNQKAVLKTK